ncbi:MAG: hypothetical protein Kow0062_27870 [Acidobacteriota bacterium]|nr:MAG: TerB family tellurite resistance protein [Acidobacteriota bacterium]
MKLLDLLGLSGGPERDREDESDTIRRIAAELEALPDDAARRVAALAFLLGRVAWVDRKVTEEEADAMVRIVAERAGLSRAQATLAVEIARTRARLHGATDNFLVARELGATIDRDEKRAILDALFAVAAADGSVSTIEANEIRLIADTLGLEHDDYIAMRSRWRDRLAVLRDPSKPPPGDSGEGGTR